MQKASLVLVDLEHPDVGAYLDALQEAVRDLADATGDHRSPQRLEHALARRTGGVRDLRRGASERLAAGWDPDGLAAETLGTQDLLSASFVDRVLAARLEAIPVEPPPAQGDPDGTATPHRPEAWRGRHLSLAPSSHVEPTITAELARMKRSAERRAGRACPDCAGQGVVELPDGDAAQCECVWRGRP